MHLRIPAGVGEHHSLVLRDFFPGFLIGRTQSGFAVLTRRRQPVAIGAEFLGGSQVPAAPLPPAGVHRRPPRRHDAIDPVPAMETTTAIGVIGDDEPPQIMTA
jgi:hypothetical protein